MPIVPFRYYLMFDKKQEGSEKSRLSLRDLGEEIREAFDFYRGIAITTDSKPLPECKRGNPY